jgi:hypothetical protein
MVHSNSGILTITVLCGGLQTFQITSTFATTTKHGETLGSKPGVRVPPSLSAANLRRCGALRIPESLLTEDQNMPHATLAAGL